MPNQITFDVIEQLHTVSKKQATAVEGAIYSPCIFLLFVNIVIHTIANWLVSCLGSQPVLIIQTAQLPFLYEGCVLFHCDLQIQATVFPPKILESLAWLVLLSSLFTHHLPCWGGMSLLQFEWAVLVALEWQWSMGHVMLCTCHIGCWRV